MLGTAAESVSPCPNASKHGERGSTLSFCGVEGVRQKPQQ